MICYGIVRLEVRKSATYVDVYTYIYIYVYIYVSLYIIILS